MTLKRASTEWNKVPSYLIRVVLLVLAKTNKLRCFSFRVPMSKEKKTECRCCCFKCVLYTNLVLLLPYNYLLIICSHSETLCHTTRQKKSADFCFWKTCEAQISRLPAIISKRPPSFITFMCFFQRLRDVSDPGICWHTTKIEDSLLLWNNCRKGHSDLMVWDYSCYEIV